MAKYSAAFINDFNWFLSVRHLFNFDGSVEKRSKDGRIIVHHDKNGVDGREAFYSWDSNGIIKPTRHPNIFRTLLKVKGSVNFHIKMWAEGRAEGTFPLVEFCGSRGSLVWTTINGKPVATMGKCLALEYRLPTWVIKAVEFQKINLIKKSSDFPDWYKFYAEEQGQMYMASDFDWSVSGFIKREFKT